MNCHAEMSADIASIPSWKIALLERKRFHDKESTGSNVNHTPSATCDDMLNVVDNGVPAWKRDILARKQNQANSSVFLARHGQTGDGQSSSTIPTTVNNGHVHALVHEPSCGNTDAAVVDIDINDAVEGQLVEERLLPIHQNPILRLDLKNRHHSSSSSSARGSTSPRIPVVSIAGGSNDHSSAVSSVSSHAAPATPDATGNEEVFGNDNDCEIETEVAYGRGFVHKLLMKFSHLSSSGCDQAPNNRHSKPRFHSLADSSKLSSGSGPRRQSSRDLESISSKQSSRMPATKYHSADDLLTETEFHPRIDGSDSADEFDVTATNDLNGECTTHLDHSAADDDAAMKRNSSCAEIADELPFANIVSNARSLFESLAVHSASQKPSASPSSIPNQSSSRFSYIGTLERSHQLKRARTDMQEASATKTFDQSYNSTNRSTKTAAEVSHSNGTANDGESFQRIADARIETDDASEPVHGNKTSSGCAIVSSASSPSSTFTAGTSTVNIFHDGSPSQSASVRADLGTCENSVHFPKSSVKEKEHKTVPPVSMTQSKTHAADMTPENTSTPLARAVHVDSSSLVSQFADIKENIKSQPPSSLGKKPAPSRPGKLVIRPASNLVAAKTSTEYLELTKFNDVRKGEFAPPMKKERADAAAYDDDVDKADGVADDCVNAEEYVFTGAGVVIGRSLLTKTNRNKSV